MASPDNKILLTFDLEEFDIPLEYKQAINVDTQMRITREGLDRMRGVIERHDIPCTFFTTAFFADHNHEIVIDLGKTHEIASHAYHHSDFKKDDLFLSKKKLEEITGKTISGFRMPRMQAVDAEELIAAGYVYDASLNPTWIPSRYNNLGKPRVFFRTPGLVHLPASVSPHLRIPLFWLFFKNMPMGIMQKISRQTLRHDGYINLYFHPWEFADIDNFHLPWWMKQPCGNALAKKLDRYIYFLKNEGVFSDVYSFIKKFPADQRR